MSELGLKSEHGRRSDVLLVNLFDDFRSFARGVLQFTPIVYTYAWMFRHPFLYIPLRLFAFSSDESYTIFLLTALSLSSNFSLFYSVPRNPYLLSIEPISNSSSFLFDFTFASILLILSYISFNFCISLEYLFFDVHRLIKDSCYSLSSY